MLVFEFEWKSDIAWLCRQQFDIVFDYWNKNKLEVCSKAIATGVLNVPEQLSTYLYERLIHFHLFLSRLCFFYYRLICLTSKCMHTSLLSLHPPQSGAAVRGFAAAVSCYDVKRTAPSSLSLCPSYMLPAASHLTPDLLPPTTPGPLSQTTCWCVPLLELQREGESQTTLQGLG